jgi:Secretion system C-terminal sorting domain
MTPITRNTLLLGLTLIGTTTLAEAQVRFKLSQPTAGQYQVSLVPDKTLSGREAITGTMQVTLRVKAADKFVLANVESAIEGVDWDKGASLHSPDGAAEFDYISVALRSIATRDIGYEAGKEVVLFRFTNAGDATARPALLDNGTDPLVTFQRNRFNVQNHISVLGYGRTNAYLGNLGDDLATGPVIGIQSIFPNPASTKTTVTYRNEVENRVGEVSFALIEAATGRVVQREGAALKLGLNQTELTVDQLSGGTYMIQMEQAGAKLGAAAKLLIVR